MEEFIIKKNLVKSESTYLDSLEAGLSANQKPMVWFQLRITARSDSFSSTDEISAFLIKNSKDVDLKKFVIGYEIAKRNKKEHWHIVYLSEKSIVPVIKLSYITFSGNSYFSEVKTDDPQRSIMYALKDQQYKSYGFSEEILNDLLQLSHKKVGDGEFSKELEHIRELYISKKITMKECFRQIYSLKAITYSQSINVKQFENIVLSWTIKRDKEVLDKLAEKSSNNVIEQYSLYQYGL